MKKFSILIVAFIIAAFSCITVFAAGINSAEQSVLQNMRTPANMNGNMVYVPTSYINQAETHFNTIDMTSLQADTINGIINEGRSFLEKSGKSSIKDLSSSEKSTMLSYASAAANALKLTAVAGSDQTRVKITTKSGDVIVDDSNSVIKTTGFSSLAVPAAIGFILALTLIAASAGLIIIYKRERVYEKRKA